MGAAVHSTAAGAAAGLMALVVLSGCSAREDPKPRFDRAEYNCDVVAHRAPVDWSRPFKGREHVVRLRDVAAAAQSGRLNFRPVDPGFGQPVVAVQVEGRPAPQPGLVIVYQFPSSKDLPGDRRVAVFQYKASQTSESIVPPSRTVTADCTTELVPVRLASGQAAVLSIRSDDELADVDFIRDGVRVRISGPALRTPLARQLADALSSRQPLR